MQETSLDFIHPRGGQALYLHTTVFRNVAGVMRTLAASVLSPRGVADGMRRAMESWSDGVKELAPVEFNDLKRSGHPKVTADGVVVYDRPPEVHRLTEQELAAKSRARGGRRGRGGV